MHKFLLFFLCSFFTYGCTKDKKLQQIESEQIASFTIDRNVCTAGDIIHLKNTSSEFKTLQWLDSKRTTYSSDNLDFMTDSTGLDMIQDFYLSVVFKNGQTSSATKTVTIKEGILMGDFFKDSILTYRPTTENIGVKGKHWVINASHIDSENSRSDIMILFADTLRLKTGGLFSLKSDTSYITSGEASITYSQHSFNPHSMDFYFVNAISTGGHLGVSIGINGRVYCTFNDIPFLFHSDNVIEANHHMKDGTMKISGIISH